MYSCWLDYIIFNFSLGHPCYVLDVLEVSPFLVIRFMYCSYRTNEVTLINFALGKHLVREDDLLSDQRGSLAYVSPDVLSGESSHFMS